MGLEGEGLLEFDADDFSLVAWETEVSSGSSERSRRLMSSPHSRVRKASISRATGHDCRFSIDTVKFIGP